MTYAVLAVLMALQIGQGIAGHLCMEFATDGPNNGWKCVDREHRPRPQDLMPLVEPLSPAFTLGVTLELNAVMKEPLRPSPFSQPVEAPYKGQDASFSGTVVPAIQETAPGTDPVVLRDPNNCVDGWISNGFYGNHCASRKYWTCKDKTNVLQVSEDGSGHWCVRF